jgi:hypothetical protein
MKQQYTVTLYRPDATEPGRFIVWAKNWDKALKLARRQLELELGDPDYTRIEVELVLAASSSGDA